MLCKMAIKDLKRYPVMNTLIVILLIAMFWVVITIASAIQLKYKKYSALSPYLTQKGICIESYNLQKKSEDGSYELLKDSAELKELFPNIRNVLSVEMLWSVSSCEIKESVTALCYSGDVINAMGNISMKEGRWFSDITPDKDILDVVITYNKSDVKVGDIITVTTGIGGPSVTAKVIGIINNGENLYYENMVEEAKGDCRDCFYTYDYDMEDGNVVLIFSDEQILSGQEDGKFKELNYRISPEYGFQKQMQGCTIITYDESISDDIIKNDTEYLKRYSIINRVYDLKQMNKASLDYVFQELKIYFPVFACILIFVLIASISINVITVKRQLKNYAIYYMCGLSWKKCSLISICESAMATIIAFSLVLLSLLVMKISGRVKTSALQLGWLQVCIMIAVSLIYIFLTWVIPSLIVNRTTAKQLLVDER